MERRLILVLKWNLYAGKVRKHNQSVGVVVMANVRQSIIIGIITNTMHYAYEARLT